MLNKNITIFIFQIIKSLIKDNMYRSKCYEPIFKIFYDATYIGTNRCSCNFIINLYKTSESAMQAHTINLIRSVNQTYVKEK